MTAVLRWSVALALSLTAAAASAPAAEGKGTFLGVLFGPVPAAVYDQAPQLERGHGVLVTHILPDSPAAEVGLRRNDVLLKYGTEKIRDCEQLARLIRDDQPGRKVALLVARGGNELAVDVTLRVGPVLEIARAADAGPPAPRASAKAGAPPAVSIAATPLSSGNLRVTVEYYHEASGRVKTLTCTGSPPEVERELKKLPARIHELARIALQRARLLEVQKAN
jgi:hypothetical protein